MKKDKKNATKDRKKVTVKDLKPKADSQVKGGAPIVVFDQIYSSDRDAPIKK